MKHLIEMSKFLVQPFSIPYKRGTVMSAIYYYGQDGETVDDDLIKMFGLSTKEIRYSDKLDANVFNIVGFVYKDNKILVVFPKHYYEKSDIDAFNKTNVNLGSDIKLLYNVIKKYRETTSASAQSYFGAFDGYTSDFPFKAFYEVYDYYQKYGIYKEKETKIIKGTTGKVSWKNTLRKSNKIISGDNLIFFPFYVNKKNYNEGFLTECMAFIIDYTIDFFNAFLSMKKTGIKYKFDFLNNIDYVLLQLKIFQSIAFKDSQKHLIQNMIDFFEQFRGKANGGKVHLRIRYFDMIWQCMIEHYINRHFDSIDAASGAAVFDESINCSTVFFVDTTFSDIDDSHHHFQIDVDHVGIANNILYIIDSKYYTDISQLNYKQFSYNEILRYHYPGVVDIQNILLLPGEEHSDLHFSLSAGYVGTRKIGTKIVEQFLSPKRVMQDYLKL